MAREIYADPFGSYIGGYDKGVQREMALQKGVRDARETDWDYYNMNPLKLETAQRNNAFEGFADPYKRDMLPIGVNMAKNNLFMSNVKAAEPAAWLGIQDPFLKAIAGQNGYNLGGTPDNRQMTDGFGNVMAGDITSAGETNPYFYRDEWWKRTDADRSYGINYSNAGVNVFNANTSAQNANTQQANIAAQAAASAAKAGGGNPYYNPGSMFGPGWSTGAAAPAAPAAAAPVIPQMPLAPPIAPAVPSAYTPGVPSAPMPAAAQVIAAAAQERGVNPQQLVETLARQYNITPEEVITKINASAQEVSQGPVKIGGSP